MQEARQHNTGQDTTGSGVSPVDVGPGVSHVDVGPGVSPVHNSLLVSSQGQEKTSVFLHITFL